MCQLEHVWSKVPAQNQKTKQAAREDRTRKDQQRAAIRALFHGVSMCFERFSVLP